MTELVIGSRRPRRQRRLRSLAIGVGLVVLAAVVCYFIYGGVVRYPEPSGEMPDGPLSAGPAPHGASGEWALFWGGECSLSYMGRLAVLRVVGKPHTVGACQGRLLGRAVTEATAPLAAAIGAAVPDTGILGEARRGPRLRWRLRLLADSLPAAQLEEIAGVVHGALRAEGVEGGAPGFETLVRTQAALDVGAPAGASPGVGYGVVARSLSFALTGASAAPAPPAPHAGNRARSGSGAGTGAGARAGSGSAARSRSESGTGSGSASGTDGSAGAGAAAAAAPGAGSSPEPGSGARLLVGRSFSLLGAEDGGERAAGVPLVSIVRPEGSIPYASVGWPGLVGVVTGVNAQGIAVLVHPEAGSDVRMTRVAQPVALLARSMLEHAHTLDEAVRMVEQTTPLGAAGFLVVDGRRRRLAWIERSPGRIRVVRDASPAVEGDLFTTEPFASDAGGEGARRLRASAERVARATELVRRAPPGGVEQAIAVLRDQARPEGAPLPLGHRAAIDDPEAAHTAVIDPVEMVLWVADSPGAGGRFRAFDLRRELRGEPPRAQPPADVPADAQRDPTAALDVVAARRDLRAARIARVAGDIARARELCARALVRRPDLPEALRVAGDLAAAAGDVAAARQLYSRALDVGVDGPDGEEALRAALHDGPAKGTAAAPTGSR